MKFIISVSFAFLFVVVSTVQAQTPRLHIVGKNMYDQNDSVVLLKGFNWGWWNEAQSQDATVIKDTIGGNMVRLALRWHWWGATDASQPMNARDSLAPGNINPNYLEILDSNIAWLAKEQLWIVLFINSDQGTGKNDEHFLNTPWKKQELLETWQFLANRYKDQPYIGVFELLAEPQFLKNNRNVSHSDLAGLYKEIMDLVTNGTIPYSIGPQNYYLPDSLVDDYYLPGYQIIYAANMFVTDEYTKGKATYGYPSIELNKNIIDSAYNVALNLREKYNVPV